MQIAVEGKTMDIPEGASCLDALKESLSGKKLRKVVACKCGGRVLDLSAPVPESCEGIEPVEEDSPEGLDLLRHSAAHVMAAAVKRLFPDVKVTIGPAIENGFYYDFDAPKPFTPEDLEAIEAEIQKIIAEDQEFSCTVMPKAEARGIFEKMGETYKLEIMDDLEQNTVSIYRNGEFVDLCRGPHIKSSGALKAVKLTHVSGAYWRGDENRPMLQRIYGTAWSDPKALKKYLNQIEEAKKRDHRKLGRELDLFSIHEDVGPGMVIWHPKGALVRTILEDFERKEHLKRGYDIVVGPTILKKDMWEISGHYDHYRENMYFTEIDEQVYGIKPMNCLSHMLVYKSRIRSYRDLPLRLFELGTVHRHERAGVLHGLLRVRQFTQDDAHILCRPDQLEEEIMGVIRFVHDVMGLFGFEYEMELSTRPEKSIGSDEDWERATNALKSAMESHDLPYEINEGDGAFYGPKIDIKLKDALERRWQCATIQCDFTLPERFDLSYVDQDGERKRPVMLHRVVLGAIERFMGVLIEHFAGAFPVWLAPVQARVLTVTDAQNEFAEEAVAALKARGIRVEADLRNEKLGYKVREAQLEKIPYILVVGDKEVEERGVNVRIRGNQNLGMRSLDETAAMILEECQKPFAQGGMSYSFAHANASSL